MLELINHFFRKPLLYLIIILIGVVFKFQGLDTKFFWLDEVFTMSHTSGIDWEEFVDSVPQDSILNIKDFNNLLDVNSSYYNIKSQIKGLSQMTQLTPLHYFYLVIWTKIVGSKPIDYRLFSIMIFLLSLPLIYLLGLELSGSKLTGLISASLFSISPYMHYFSQEGRYYMLWVFSIILVNLILLKALNKNNYKWWILYVISGVFAMYVSPLSALILIGHLVYVWFIDKKHRIPFSISGTSILLCYLPWMIAMFSSRSTIMHSTNWQDANLKLWQIISGPWYGFAHAFYTPRDSYMNWYLILQGEAFNRTQIDWFILSLLIILIIVVVIYFIKKAPTKMIWFLILTLIPSFIFFISFDLIEGKMTSVIFRYHITGMIAIVLIFGWYLGNKAKGKKLFPSFLYIGIVVLGMYSMMKISEDPCYMQDGCEPQIAAAEIVTDASKPLIISESSSGNLFRLYEVLLACKSSSIDVLYKPNPKKIAEFLTQKRYTNIYLIEVSSELKYAMIKNHKTSSLFEKVPIPIFLDSYSQAMVYNSPANINDFKLDLSSSIITNLIEINFKSNSVPLSDTVYITGNHYSIGDWDPKAVPLQKVSKGHWNGNFQIQKGEQLEFKFTRGDWITQLLDDYGNIINNYTLEVKQDTTITIIANSWNDK
jgi:uncharacterized membrane protein